MKIVFDEKAKKALEEMIENSNENYIRVKPSLVVENQHMKYMQILKVKMILKN